MKSIRLQLLVTLVATVLVAGVFVAKGLPPSVAAMDAVMARDVGQLCRYLNWGGDPNGKTYQPPLAAAAWQGNGETVELLITAGADVNAEALDPTPNVDSHYLLTPLAIAEQGKHKHVAALLREHGAVSHVWDLFAD